MAIEAITSYKQNNKKPHYGVRAAVGAVSGAALRYVVPKKDEMHKAFSKDSFKKLASDTMNRAKDRSILKYAGIGAAAAVAFGAISKAFSSHKQDNIPELLHIEYSKYGALLDSSDCASELIWMA